MYVAHDQEAVGSGPSASVRLPDTRPAFYEKIVEELLLYRRDAQTGDRTSLGSELKKVRQRILGQIALAHLMDANQNANSLNWADAVDSLKVEWNIESAALADRRLRELSVETGIFSEERPNESLRSLHLFDMRIPRGP
jgi:hypothetical protein